MMHFAHPEVLWLLGLVPLLALLRGKKGHGFDALFNGAGREAGGWFS